MKKLIFVIFITFPFLSFSQKIQNVKTNEVADLKQKVDNYFSVVQQPYKGKIDFFIGTNELGVWKLLDESGNPIQFQTIVAVMNHLHKNGWDYINNIGGSDGAAPQYFFRKRE